MLAHGGDGVDASVKCVDDELLAFVFFGRGGDGEMGRWGDGV